MFSTDKIGHGYLPIYMGICAELTAKTQTTFGSPVRLLEVGVANGEGLVMFAHLLPHAQLWGVDVNERAVWPEGTHRVVGRQEDPGLRDRLPSQFSIIIDDASHNNDLTTRTFENLWDLVVPGGFYVIEDWNHAGGLIRELAKELVDCFHEAQPLYQLVDSIVYRHGLIIVRKKACDA